MLDKMLSMAHDAGDVLLPYYGRLGTADARRKGGRHRDLVSEADLKAEEMILRQIPPDDDVLAEETGERSTGAERLWIVDPLDGTINFLHGIPFWSVSIALLQQGRLEVAVVHAPALGMTFTATRDQGCRLEGVEVSVSDTDTLGDAILATGFPYARDTVADNNFDNISRVGLLAGGLRRFGSAALDLAFTACGKLDGFWELHLEPWDVAAGVLLVREAGGRVTDFGGDGRLERLLYGRNLIASNTRIHEGLREVLAPLREI